MKVTEILDIIRAAIRPYLAFIFPTTVVIVGGLIAFKLLPGTLEFMDRDIALVIIVAVLAIVTMLATATTTVIGFYFGERATKKTSEK